MNILVKLGVNAVALWVAALVVPGITLVQEGSSTGAKALSIVLIAAIFGLINILVKPIAIVLSLPALILTLGLFTVVVNAAMLQLLSWVSGKLDLSFHVENFFWSAILGALIISLVSWVLNTLVPDERD
ncbi:phage holin family protein [Dermacoccaceae bacterium W4C1]